MTRLWMPALLLSYALLLLMGPQLMPLIQKAVAASGAPATPHAHPFVDTRAWLGLPNAADTLSNLPFAVLGGWLLLRLRRVLLSRVQHRCLSVLAWGLLLTALGSGLYHWAPTAQTLVADRLGMAVLFAGVLGLAVTERGLSAAAPQVLALMLPLGALAAALPLWGNVLPWALVQYGGVLALVGLALRQLQPGALGVRWAWVLAGYGLAKLCENQDAAIFALSGEWISGHTLKHLAAAAAVVPVLWPLRGRGVRAS
ncbi:hypothetical protein HNQ51_002108 [Inhella inkyongensis]|uniref:Alkaline phytoceramidase n=1 Tax=Inhella inkyongensis TaxID=392593 RepID=A0A840S7N0_9BURK|nr:hypothetical protein [Inhella inkyongensis]MBB5204794.1 hypothetical protein [Inhella inkyongensis]